MRRRKLMMLIAALAAFSLLAVACSSGSKKSSSKASEGSTSASQGARGVTAKQIIVEGVSPITSATGGYVGVDVGAAARFERQNKQGGVQGRQIKYLGTLDDTENGAKNLDLVRKAVLQDHAFAIVPALGQGFLPATGAFLNQNQVPSVGWGFMPLQCSGKPDFGFGFNGCIIPKTAVDNSAAAPIMKKMGAGTTVALVSDDTDASRTGLKLVAAQFEHFGAKIVYNKSNVPTSQQVDYTSFVQDIMTSNGGKPPELVVFQGRFANTAGITGGLRGAGYKGATVNYTAYVPGLLDKQPDLAKALNGSYVITQFLPAEFGGSAIDQMKKDIEAYKPGAEITLGTSLSYWMADVFVQMLNSVGPNLTPANFNKVINGGWSYKPVGDPPGLGVVAYPQDHSEPTGCAAMVQIKGTKYIPVTPMTCYPKNSSSPTS